MDSNEAYELEIRTANIAANLKYIEENTDASSLEKLEEQTGNIAANLKAIAENDYQGA